MRIGYNVIVGSLRTHWQYAPVRVLSKAKGLEELSMACLNGNFYTNSLKTLVSDWRNLGMRIAYPQKTITPLADINRKGIAGFNLRLSKVKHPSKIRHKRRYAKIAPQSGYALTNDGDKALVGVMPVEVMRMPFISSGKGWGVKSSLQNKFLGKQNWKTLKKKKIKHNIRLFRLGKSISLLKDKGFLENIDDNLSEEEDLANVFYGFSIEISLDKKLLENEVGLVNLEDDEDPNITIKVTPPPINLEYLEDDYEDFFNWIQKANKNNSFIESDSFDFFIKKINLTYFLSFVKKWLFRKNAALFLG
jgi:hypothetical protein